MNQRFAHPTYKICSSHIRKMPIRYTKIDHIRSTKNAYPTYEKCPSDIRKMNIRPKKRAHSTYEKCPPDLWKCPSDLPKVPIWPTKLSDRPTVTINYFYPNALLRIRQKLLNRSDWQTDMPIRPTAVVGQMLQ